ncbi:MAG: ribonuclease P protein component [Candidatus Acidiferrales bacterium]
MAEGEQPRTGRTRRERAGGDAEPQGREQREGARAAKDASVAGVPVTNGVQGQPGKLFAKADQEKRNLPREWRLVRRSEFEAVYREGRRRSSATFLIFLRANGLPRDRFGMSVKKALGNAVVRNRIRRRIREVLRLHREEILPGWDVVIHPSRSVATLEFTKLEAELLALLPREKRAAK